VSALANHSNDIRAVVKAIHTIANQTNLLALNATIEASRAGDAGKGFAVVASEVKELAKTTSQATENAVTSIDAIFLDIQRATAAIAKVGGTLRGVDALANEIAGAVEEQGAVTADIRRSLDEAMQGTVAIDSSIGAVARAAAAATDGAERAASSAAGVHGVAGRLHELVTRFKVAA
jgi:methyl-accepting chemotaxis protein